jgi:hypothetical protein
MYEQIKKEIGADPFYVNNFANEGQQFVAWYLRRVLLLDIHATRASITDGQLDKQIDAIVVEDGDDRRVRVIQGKFTKPSSVDAAPVREVLSAWERLRDLPSLQVECSGKLAERLEAMRLALEEDYEVQFELLTTGSLTSAALADVDAFKKLMSESTELSAGLTVVDSDLIETRLSEAEQKDLPELNTSIQLDKNRYIESSEAGVRVVIAMLPVERCLKLPGIVDQKLFRRNVRQSLGLGNKVNKGIRETLTNPQKSPYLFFFHNGITALCRSFDISNDVLLLKGLAVVNGCQSLSTIYATSGKIAQKQGTQGALLFRFYEIPEIELGDSISVNTNSQSAVKPRDLRSNDKAMRQIKQRYESEVDHAYFITKRGEDRPSDKDPNRCIDSPDYAKMVISWLCQRPNSASNEKRLFDEYYKKLFSPQLDSQSMLALKLWLVEIDKSWEALAINEAVKAVKGAARFHLLFTVSQLFAHASDKSDSVPLPSATISSLKFAGQILNQAKQCINQALQQAVMESKLSGKIFSPQNWLKSGQAVNHEQLVAGTIVNVLKGMEMGEVGFINSLSLPPTEFVQRWSAE